MEEATSLVATCVPAGVQPAATCSSPRVGLPATDLQRCGDDRSQQVTSQWSVPPFSFSGYTVLAVKREKRKWYGPSKASRPNYLMGCADRRDRPVIANSQPAGPTFGSFRPIKAHPPLSLPSAAILARGRQRTTRPRPRLFDSDLISFLPLPFASP